MSMHILKHQKGIWLKFPDKCPTGFFCIRVGRTLGQKSPALHVTLYQQSI